MGCGFFRLELLGQWISVSVKKIGQSTHKGATPYAQCFKHTNALGHHCHEVSKFAWRDALRLQRVPTSRMKALTYICWRESSYSYRPWLTRKKHVWESIVGCAVHNHGFIKRNAYTLRVLLITFRAQAARNLLWNATFRSVKHWEIFVSLCLKDMIWTNEPPISICKVERVLRKDVWPGMCAHARTFRSWGLVQISPACLQRQLNAGCMKTAFAPGKEQPAHMFRRQTRASSDVSAFGTQRSGGSTVLYAHVLNQTYTLNLCTDYLLGPMSRQRTESSNLIWAATTVG